MKILAHVLKLFVKIVFSLFIFKLKTWVRSLEPQGIELNTAKLHTLGFAKKQDIKSDIDKVTQEVHSVPFFFFFLITGDVRISLRTP